MNLYNLYTYMHTSNMSSYFRIKKEVTLWRYFKHWRGRSMFRCLWRLLWWEKTCETLKGVEVEVVSCCSPISSLVSPSSISVSNLLLLVSALPWIPSVSTLTHFSREMIWMHGRNVATDTQLVTLIMLSVQGRLSVGRRLNLHLVAHSGMDRGFTDENLLSSARSSI